jgi:hypothetical protein
MISNLDLCDLKSSCEPNKDNKFDICQKEIAIEIISKDKIKISKNKSSKLQEIFEKEEHFNPEAKTHFTRETN